MGSPVLFGELPQLRRREHGVNKGRAFLADSARAAFLFDASGAVVADSVLENKFVKPEHVKGEVCHGDNRLGHVAFAPVLTTEPKASVLRRSFAPQIDYAD